MTVIFMILLMSCIPARHFRLLFVSLVRKTSNLALLVFGNLFFAVASVENIRKTHDVIFEDMINYFYKIIKLQQIKIFNRRKKNVDLHNQVISLSEYSTKRLYISDTMLYTAKALRDIN